MSMIKRTFAVLKTNVVVAVLIWHAGAAAQDHGAIRPSLVHLQVTGVTETGAPLEAHGTGFLVSRDGLLITTFHTLRRFVADDVVDVKIAARVGSNGPPFNERDVFVMGTIPDRDLALLRIRSETQFEPVALGRSNDLEVGTGVATSGFPRNLPDVWTDEDRIRSITGLVGFLWVTNMEFLEGQSGSPVYLDDGTVIGIVKGSLKNTATRSVFVPIDHADPLLITLRFSKVEERLKSLNTKCRVCIEAKNDNDVICTGQTDGCSKWTPLNGTSDEETWSEFLNFDHQPTLGFASCGIKWRLECEKGQ